MHVPRITVPPNKALHQTRRQGVPASRAVVEGRLAGEGRCWADVSWLRVTAKLEGRSPVHKTAIPFLAASVVFLASSSLGSEATTDTLFRRVVQPTGWAIPKHGTQVKAGASRGLAGVPKGVNLVEFDASQSEFSLPRHYVDNGSLVLLSLRFRASTITRLDVGGRPYAWFMFATGADTGLAADVWLLDRDGDGRFVELEWNPNLTRLPDWVAKRLDAESTKSP